MVEFWTAIITVVIASVVGPLATRIWDWAVGRKDTTLQDLDMRVRRMEILENIREHPEDEHTILDLFDQYEKKGGNSYIKVRVQQWQQEFQQTTTQPRRKKSGH